MSAVKHIVASGECEKYSALRIYSYVYVYIYSTKCYGILLVCDAPICYRCRSYTYDRGILYSHSEI